MVLDPGRVARHRDKLESGFIQKGASVCCC
jgi:hypothetical protein